MSALSSALGVGYSYDTIADLNDINHYSGILHVERVSPTAQNNPFGENYCQLVTFARCFQIAVDYWGTSLIKFRTFNNGVWQPWHTFTMTD